MEISLEVAERNHNNSKFRPVLQTDFPSAKKSAMSHAWPHPIKAVIFDNDGTILDSVKCYVQVDSEMIGQQFPDSLVAQINGLREDAECQKVIELYNLDMTVEEFKTRRTPRLYELLRECDTVPGIEDVIKKVKSMGIPIAVATSSGRALFNMKITKHHAIFDLFDAIVTGDEVTHAKPAPDIFQKAMAKLGTFAPENVLVIEDATNGVKAANLAGCPVLMMTETEKCGLHESLAKGDAHPTLMIDRYEDFDFDQFIWEGRK